MRSSRRSRRAWLRSGAGALGLAALVAGGLVAIRPANAGFPWFKKGHHHVQGTVCATCFPVVGEGAWYWVRSPEQEKQVVMNLYARYCVRCHGVDGRGVWDIPGVPNFTDLRWQACRDDGALARSILEGRGAVMPPFRGTITLEEAWAMSRYLRTFVPGTEVPKPDLGPSGATPATPATSPGAAPIPAPVAPAPPPPMPPASSRGAFVR
jgi:mono/diheme cytochrome c family protein